MDCLKAVSSDSSHRADTTRFHYTYSGTGTINNTNSLQSYVLSNAPKLSLAMDQPYSRRL